MAKLIQRASQHAPVASIAADVGSSLQDNVFGMAGNAADVDAMGVEAGASEMATEQGAQGPFGSSLLNAALSSAFGTDLGGLAARFGEGRENSAIGAAASTRGANMSFGADVGEDTNDRFSMEVVGEEVAHALAGGGSGAVMLDQEGDQGEAKAQSAGAAFAAWATSGFQGPAPQLAAATGGQAAIHRHPVTRTTAVTGSPMLRVGSSGNLVRSLQSLLNARGYRVVADGIFGPGTDRAVRAFQASHGFTVDGTVGPTTAAALNSGAQAIRPQARPEGLGQQQAAQPAQTTTALTGSPLLRQGMNGALVRTLQVRLNALGASITVDGDFGPGTDRVLKAFQTANGLRADGQFGPGTAARLNSPTAARIPAGAAQAPQGGRQPFQAPTGRVTRDDVINAARSHLGKPYYWGGSGPSNFDCSGLVCYMLQNQLGLVRWGRDTAHGIKNRLPRANAAQRGDCVFYWSGSRVTHVEFSTGSGNETIGASGGGSRTFGNDPNAKVQYGNHSRDRRSKTFGSIANLLAAS